MAQEKTGFHYLGIGCLIAGILLVLVGSVVAIGVYRWGKGLEAELRDPDSRRDTVLGLLGADELPEGYHAMLGLRVPLLLQTAILTDREAEPGEEPELGERGLIYFMLRDFGGDRQDLDDFFAGRSDDTGVLEKHKINVDLGERLAHGSVDRASGPIHWVAHRGDLSSAHARGRHEGLVTLFQIHCSDDSYNRIGMLFGPEAVARSEGTVNPDGEPLAGTVADPERVEWFVGHFRFCPA